MGLTGMKSCRTAVPEAVSNVVSSTIVSGRYRRDAVYSDVGAIEK